MIRLQPRSKKHSNNPRSRKYRPEFETSLFSYDDLIRTKNYLKFYAGRVTNETYNNTYRHTPRFYPNVKRI